MRGLINDWLRRLIGYGIVTLGLILSIVQWVRIRSFRSNQSRLRRRYEITASTPVLPYGDDVEKLIQTAATQASGNARFAMTSGSTSHPKRTLYTKQRLRSLKFAYIDVFVRCCWAMRIKRSSLYVFSSLDKDDSLTSMLLDEDGIPDYLSTLQAPYRLQCHPAIQALASDYGTTAVRLWILAIANPGVLYSTNPSTLSSFFDEITTQWQQSTRLIRDWCINRETFDRSVHMIVRRLKSRGSDDRLAHIANSGAPLTFQEIAPAVETYVSWTGGYVKPFLDRLAIYLPAERYRLVPMYSMSTETIETVTSFHGDAVTFLPLARRVLYEFIEETRKDQSQNLITIDQLEVGMAYTMVVSDPHGLRRYQTGDLFLCKRMVAGLPDLHFLRRRDLEYSFTGEKLTAEHVSTVFQMLREEYSQLGTDRFLSCVPSQPLEESIPHYKVFLIGEGGNGSADFLSELGRRCDQLLGLTNCEYKSKRQSGRLGEVRLMQVTSGDFINQIGGPRQSNTWEAQFKFLPLYRRTWENDSHQDS
jgi:hypothetical protein